MTPVTEIVNVLLNTVAAKTVQDDSSEAGKAFASMREVLPQQKGYLGSYWGCTVEDPKRVIWLIGQTMTAPLHIYAENEC